MIFDSSKKTGNLVLETMRQKQAWSHVTEWFSRIYCEKAQILTPSVLNLFPLGHLPCKNGFLIFFIELVSEYRLGSIHEVLCSYFNLFNKEAWGNLYLGFFWLPQQEKFLLYEREGFPDIGKEISFWVAKKPLL